MAGPAVAASETYSMVLKNDGSVWATGANGDGQLGDGSNTDKTDFVEVVSSDVTAMALGGSFSILLTQDGSVLATGQNSDGQFGDGTTTNQNSFVTVVSSGVQSVAAGAQHTIISKNDGAAYTAGSNEEGQLGSGNSTESTNTFMRLIIKNATWVPLKVESIIRKTNTDDSGVVAGVTVAVVLVVGGGAAAVVFMFLRRVKKNGGATVAPIISPREKVALPPPVSTTDVQAIGDDAKVSPKHSGPHVKVNTWDTDPASPAKVSPTHSPKQSEKVSPKAWGNAKVSPKSSVTTAQVDPKDSAKVSPLSPAANAKVEPEPSATAKDTFHHLRSRRGTDMEIANEDDLSAELNAELEQNTILEEAAQEDKPKITEESTVHV